MVVTLECATGKLGVDNRWVYSIYQKTINMPFIPQIGMSLIIDDYYHKVKYVTWHQSNGAIVVEVETGMYNYIENGWTEVKL